MKIDTPLFLENRIQEYAWGSRSAIQRMLGKSEGDQTPWAEMWMGAHPKAPSLVRINDEKIELDKLIERNPEQVLGRKTAEKFNNTLPYLFKVLAAEEPLSIQAHPDAFSAAEGFDRENRMKIAMDAPHRNYKDPRAKPECICALEPFTALNGFRAAESIVGLLEQYCPVQLRPVIDGLKKTPDAAGIKTLFRILMTLNSEERKEVLSEAVKNAEKNDSRESLWLIRLAEAYPGDIGILSPLFLKLVRLRPGQAMFLPPGRPHAYLYGVGIELMGNSDNVLRGGLTKKHVDLEELMRTLVFDPTPIDILSPEQTGPCERQYMIDVDEFRLSDIMIDPHRPYVGPEEHSAEILLCVEGEARIPSGSLSLTRGDSMLVASSTRTYSLEGNARFYKASVPVN